MTASTPSTRIVEIDGLWFRFQKYRGRRSLRSAVALTDLLGAGVLQLFASEEFEALDKKKQIEALGKLIASAHMMGGRAKDPDVFEKHAAELMHWTPGQGGQGVSYCEERLDPHAQGWVSMVNVASLDPYEHVDFTTHLMILWEIIKIMRPTRAGSGTSAGTAPADGTASGGRTTQTSGSQTTPTPSRTGVVDC